jgi:hypothetical protein
LITTLNIQAVDVSQLKDKGHNAPPPPPLPKKILDPHTGAEVWVIDLDKLPPWMRRNLAGQLELVPDRIDKQVDIDAAIAAVDLMGGEEIPPERKKVLYQIIAKSKLVQAYLVAVRVDMTKKRPKK